MQKNAKKCKKMQKNAKKCKKMQKNAKKNPIHLLNRIYFFNVIKNNLCG
jgi:hypothetical protein